MARWAGIRKLVAALALILPVPVATAEAACRIAVLGDLLASSYGLDLAEGFPARLEQRLRAAGHACEVLDAGVAGDTSAGGRARLEWLLADQPSHVIVELGGNDALRALPPAELERNLDAILARLAAEEIPTLLAGMLAPPNLGTDYGAAFAAVYPRLAERYAVPLYPFFLEGVAGDPELNQPDGIHPSAAGIERIVDGIFPLVDDWLSATPVDAAASLGEEPAVVSD